MKKSRKTYRAEPSDLSWVKNFPDCAQLFAEAGWLVFFKKIEGYHSEVSYKFAQCLDKDVVSFHTLKFELTRELLAEATGILDEGEFWFKKVPFTFYAQRYLLPSSQKMSCRVREHQDHTKQSVFHHGLIKLIISTVLQKREKTW